MKQERRALHFILDHQWTYVIWKMLNWTYVIWKMLNWRQSTRKTKDELYSEVICKRRFRILCSIHWTRVFSISNDSRQDHGYHLQIAGLRWTSSRCSISLNPSEDCRCSQIIENSTIGVSRHLDSSTTTQMAQIMVQYGRSSCSSWKESVRSSIGRTIMGKAMWEVTLKHCWEKIPNWECLFVHRKKGLFLSVYVDDMKLAGKKQNLNPMWKILHEEVDLGEPTSFLDHVYLDVYLGCTQRQCKISKDIVDNYRTMFEWEFPREELSNHHSLKILVFLHGLVTWLVMQRSMWKDIESWQTGRHNNSTKYLLHASMTTTSKKKKWNLLENCQKYAFK